MCDLAQHIHIRSGQVRRSPGATLKERVAL